MQNNTFEGNIDSNYILNLDKKKLSELSRISTIGELILISKGEYNKQSIRKLNYDTIIASKFIVEKIKSILKLDPNTITEYKIAPIVKKIGNELYEKGDCKNSVIGLFIQNIALEISLIHLRYERKERNKRSLTDSLTGLYNRAMIDIEIQKNIELKNRNNTDFSILLMDIDFFKKINDTYGHQTGDIVLQNLAKILRTFFRKNDIIGRWGGEEFMIILPSSNAFVAAKRADEIRKIINKTLTISINEIKENITVTIGVTQIEEKNISIEQLTKYADIALYKGKEKGRNQVRVYLENKSYKYN